MPKFRRPAARTPTLWSALRPAVLHFSSLQDAKLTAECPSSRPSSRARTSPATRCVNARRWRMCRLDLSRVAKDARDMGSREGDSSAIQTARARRAALTARSSPAVGVRERPTTRRVVLLSARPRTSTPGELNLETDTVVYCLTLTLLAPSTGSLFGEYSLFSASWASPLALSM